MQPCASCGFEPQAASPAAIIATLRSAAPRLDGLLAGAGPEAAARRPAPGVWSVAEYAGHLADGVDWYHARIVRVLTEDDPRLTALDWAAETDARHYASLPLARLAGAVRSQCEALADALERVEAAAWGRTGTGSEGGARSVLLLARRAAHEVVHHLDDIAAQLRPSR